MWALFSFRDTQLRKMSKGELLKELKRVAADDPDLANDIPDLVESYEGKGKNAIMEKVRETEMINRKHLLKRNKEGDTPLVYGLVWMRQKRKLKLSSMAFFTKEIQERKNKEKERLDGLIEEELKNSEVPGEDKKAKKAA